MAGVAAGTNPSTLRDELDDYETITKEVMALLEDYAIMKGVPTGVSDDGNLETSNVKMFQAGGDNTVEYKMSSYIDGVLESGDRSTQGLEAIVAVLVREITNQVTKSVINHIKENLTVTIPSGAVVTIVAGGSMAPAIGIPNILPIKCNVDNQVDTALVGGTIAPDLT